MLRSDADLIDKCDASDGGITFELEGLSKVLNLPVPKPAKHLDRRATQLRTMAEACCRGLVDLTFKDQGGYSAAFPFVVDLDACLTRPQHSTLPPPNPSQLALQLAQQNVEDYEPVDEDADADLGDFATTVWHGKKKRDKAPTSDGADSRCSTYNLLECVLHDAPPVDDAEAPP